MGDAAAGGDLLVPVAAAQRGPRVRRLAARLRPGPSGPARGPAALPAGPARALPAATYQTLIALAAATGIRPCEAIRMNDGDAGQAALVLTVHGKNRKERQ